MDNMVKKSIFFGFVFIIAGVALALYGVSGIMNHNDNKNIMIILAGLAFVGGGILSIVSGLNLKKSSTNLKYDNTDINQVKGPDEH